MPRSGYPLQGEAASFSGNLFSHHKTRRYGRGNLKGSLRLQIQAVTGFKIVTLNVTILKLLPPMGFVKCPAWETI